MAAAKEFLAYSYQFHQNPYNVQHNASLIIDYPLPIPSQYICSFRTTIGSLSPAEVTFTVYSV